MLTILDASNFLALLTELVGGKRRKRKKEEKRKEKRKEEEKKRETYEDNITTVLKVESHTL